MKEEKERKNEKRWGKVEEKEARGARLEKEMKMKEEKRVNKERERMEI